jgi:hypothetical protein
MAEITSKGQKLFSKQKNAEQVVENLNNEVYDGKSLHSHYTRLIGLTLGDIYRNGYDSITSDAKIPLTQSQVSARTELKKNCTQIISPRVYALPEISVEKELEVKSRPSAGKR